MAKGSHATLGGWEPRTCLICNQRIVVSRESLWFHWDHNEGIGYTWHTACIRKNRGLRSPYPVDKELP